MAYLCATSSTPVDSLQLLHRFREVHNIHMAIDERRESRPTDPDQLKEQLLNTLASYSDALTTDLDDYLRIRHPDFEAVHAENLAHENQQRCDYANMVLALLEETGRNVITQPVTLDESTAEAHDQARNEIRAEHYDAVAHASTLTPHEAEMRREQELTYEGECALERYDLLEFFGLEPETTNVKTVRELAEADRGGKLRAQIRLLITARANDERIQALRRREATNLEDQRWGTGAPEIMRTPFALQRELYRRILAAANINPDTLEQSGPYTASSALPHLEAIARDRKRYATIVNIPRLTQLRKNPNQWLGQQLRRYGLRTRRIQGTTAVSYTLDLEARSHLVRYLMMAEQALDEGIDQPAHPTGISINNLPGALVCSPPPERDEPPISNHAGPLRETTLQHPAQATPPSPENPSTSPPDPAWLVRLKECYHRGDLDSHAREYLELIFASSVPQAEKVEKYAQVARYYQLLPNERLAKT